MKSLWTILTLLLLVALAWYLRKKFGVFDPDHLSDYDKKQSGASTESHRKDLISWVKSSGDSQAGVAKAVSAFEKMTPGEIEVTHAFVFGFVIPKRKPDPVNDKQLIEQIRSIGSKYDIFT